MANDFSSDPRCKALWRFESGALTADSRGPTPSPPTMLRPKTPWITGKGLAALISETDASQYFSIADGSLDAGYPLKSGDADQKVYFMLLVQVGNRTRVLPIRQYLQQVAVADRPDYRDSALLAGICESTGGTAPPVLSFGMLSRSRLDAGTTWQWLLTVSIGFARSGAMMRRLEQWQIIRALPPTSFGWERQTLPSAPWPIQAITWTVNWTRWWSSMTSCRIQKLMRSEMGFSLRTH